MTPAGKLQRYLKRRMKETGGQYRKLKWEGRRAAPDTLVWWRNPNFAFIEVKVGDDALSVLQEREIKRLRDAGFWVFVAKTEQDIEEIIFTLTQPRGCIN